MKLEQVVKSELTHVELAKNVKSPIGLNIRDAKKEAGPTVKNVTLKSPAGRSFAITQGDTLQSINGQSTSGKKFKDVVRMIKDAGPCVSLELQYKLHEIRISRSGVYRTQQLTRNLKKENGSFGFVLRKKDSAERCRTKYPIISNIKEGSQVHKNNQVLDGDRLISVNGLNLSFLSLSEIASVLQDTDEAEFTFEYNVRVVDFVGLEQRFDFEIDIPISDLGLIITHTDATMYVENIRSGSVAERCGVFSEGDIILSINGIETNFLTPSKANSLLSNSNKMRKISFIKNIRKEINAISVSDSAEISSIASAKAEKCTTETTTSGVETTDWKHVNTPASSNIAFSVQQNFYSQKFCHAEQMDAIEKFQHMVPVMSSLKHDLLRLTDETFNAGPNSLNESCSLCGKTQHSVKVCASCLARMSIKCAESLEFLTSIIVQFVNSSTVTRNLSPQSAIGAVGRRIGENQSTKFSISRVIVALTETLPSIFPDLQENFAELVEKVHNVDTSCSTCDFEVKSVVLIIQKLLLLVSLRNNSEQQTLDLIDQLVCCLLQTKFTCYGEPKHPPSVADNEYNISTSENLSDGEILQDDASTSMDMLSGYRNSAESLRREIKDSKENITNTSHLNTKTNPDFLKIAHVSESQNSLSVNEANGNNKKNGASLDKEEATSLPVNNLENWSMPSTSKEALINIDKEVHSDKVFKLTSKVRRFKNSFSRPKKYGKIPTVIQNSGQTMPKQSKVAESSEVNDVTPYTSSSTRYLSTDYTPTAERENISSSNTGSTKFSRHSLENESYHEQRRVQAETMEVKLENHGDGFGLGISLQFVEESDSVIPVIHAIKPKSPSHKRGILKVGDRIIAINHQSTLGLSTKDLIKLRNRAFSARFVILTVEFDVANEEPKFGTFDVILKRTLKTGLIFEAMKKGSPMIVSGIVKGSAAHRSDQLFVGDKIMAIKCNRSEDFDPFTSSFKKEGNVLVTVQRDYNQGAKMKSVGKSPYYINPAFSYEDFVPRNGTNFVVRRTIIRAVGNTEALVFDQEVTLYRDLQFWDFGFLVGESENTGHTLVIDIRPDSPAHQSGVVKKFDRVVEVNGVLVDRNTENSAVNLISQANHKVDLLIRRLYHEDPKML